MKSLQNDRFLRAAACEPVDMTPVWLMRQAGRYLPAYRETRARAGNFMTLCKTPALACEVTLQPLDCYDLDAAIIFSDILTIPDAMGLELKVLEGVGPVFANPLRDEHDIAKLTSPDPEQLSYVYAAIELVQRELSGQIPLIGFAGSPWTLAAYMLEGMSKPGFPRLMEMSFSNPDVLHKLLNKLTKSVIAHLNGQIRAGAQAVMIFDTWGGLLKDEAAYGTFSLDYLKEIMGGLLRFYNDKKVPVVLFAKGTSPWLATIAASGCDVVGVDNQISLQRARALVGDKVALQGNLDPAVLLQSPEEIRKEVANTLASHGEGNGHVFNLGHGITPDVPPEHVKVMVDAVHAFSQRG